MGWCNGNMPGSYPGEVKSLVWVRVPLPQLFGTIVLQHVSTRIGSKRRVVDNEHHLVLFKKLVNPNPRNPCKLRGNTYKVIRCEELSIKLWKSIFVNIVERNVKIKIH